MTEAGKPIYSRYGDEEDLAPFFATLSAILPKIQSYFVTVAVKDQINRVLQISSKKFDFAVLRKGNLVYLCLSNSKAALTSGKKFTD
jgi:hypothetical protein